MNESPAPARDGDTSGDGVPAPRPGRRRIRALIAVVGYVAILALATRTIDMTRFTEVLSRLTVDRLAAVLGLIVVHLGTRGLRYHALAVRAGAKNYRLADGLRIFLLGLSASAATPARAGDVVKAELLKAHDVRRAKGLGLVVIERLLDLLVVTGTIVVTGTLLARQAQHSALQIGAGVLLVALLAGIGAVTIRRWRIAAIGVFARVVGRVVKRFKPERIEDITSRIFDVWDDVFASPRVLGRYLLLSTVAWLADFVKLWVLLWAAGAHVPLLAVLFVYPLSLIIGIISLLPFSEGVVGVAAVALLNKLAGVELETATAAVAVDRGISTLSPLVFYSLFALAQGVSKRRGG
jgi:glycosyltransferase AglD